jgi:hypothetical protein
MLLFVYEIKKAPDGITAGGLMLLLQPGLVPSALPSGRHDDHQDDSKDQDQYLLHFFYPFLKIKKPPPDLPAGALIACSTKASAGRGHPQDNDDQELQDIELKVCHIFSHSGLRIRIYSWFVKSFFPVFQTGRSAA